MMYNNVNTGYKYLKVFFAQALNNLFVKKEGILKLVSNKISHVKSNGVR